MTRRSFFATLAALPVFARLLPKPKPTGGLFNPKVNIAKLYQEQIGAVIGDTIAIRLPIYARGRRGEEADPQALDERAVFLENSRRVRFRFLHHRPPAFDGPVELAERNLGCVLKTYEASLGKLRIMSDPA